MPPSISKHLRNPQRKIEPVNSAEYFSVAEEIFHETECDPTLDRNQRWQIAKHAEAYLSGGTLSIASASLRGHFGGTTREELSASLPQYDRESSIADSDRVEVPSATQDALASRAQVLQDVTRPIIGATPITKVRGKDVFPHAVTNSSGEECILKRIVTSWPHELRAENHAERWEKTGRPYVQNTPWKRRKIIPEFVPKKQPPGLGRSAHSPHAAGVDANNAPHSRPTTPVRQIITIDSQQAVLRGHADTQADQNSCQTVELLSDSYIGPGDLHARLQDVLQSADPEASPSNIALGTEANTSWDLSTPIKLNQLEEAIDRELSELPSTLLLPDELSQDELSQGLSSQNRALLANRPQYTESVILVNSSFDEEADQPSATLPLSHVPAQPSSGSSTDRIESSQPEERATPQVTSGSESISKHGRSPKIGGHEQRTIKTAFQINKSFERKSQTAGTTSQKSPAHLFARVMPSIEDAVADRFPLSDSTIRTFAKQSPAISQPKKGILRYGKKKSTVKRFSCSSNTAFLNDSSYSQHQSPEQALIKKHGYNYDVGYENQFESDVSDIRSFLTSWNSEQNKI